MQIKRFIFLILAITSPNLYSQTSPIVYEQLVQSSEQIVSMLSTITRNPELADRMKPNPKDLRNGILRIPKLGAFKFKETKIPGRIKGILYTKSENQIKQIKMGAIKLTKIQMILTAEEPPAPEIDILLFGIKGKLFKKKLEKKEDDDNEEIVFTLLLEKPLKIPIGIKKFLELRNFTFTMSDDAKIIQTESTLPVASKPKVFVKADLNETPLSFSITAEELPLSLLSDVIEQTPLKILKLKNVKFKITPKPLSVTLIGQTNITKFAKKINITVEDKPIKVLASISKEDGLALQLDLPNVTLPFKMGTINTPVMTIRPKEFAESLKEAKRAKKGRRKK